MRATGIVRCVDELGRIVIPREIIKTMKIQKRERGTTKGDPMEIFVDGESIILKKYNPGCFKCGSMEDVHNVDGIKICKECAKKFAKAVK